MCSTRQKKLAFALVGDEPPTEFLFKPEVSKSNYYKIIFFYNNIDE